MIVACPDCPAARALVMHDGLWSNVWLAVTPFALVAIVIVIVVQRIRRHDG
jgi:uncharacterized membrane protein